MRKLVKTYLSGLLMGAADVVPGVSGGTIAFILGIYTRLIDALSGVNKESITLLIRGQWKALWQHFDGNFLVALALGIGTSIVALAHLISYWLVTYPTFLWSFFFGLILASSVLLYRAIGKVEVRHGLFFLLGVMLGVSLALAVPTQLQISLPMVFFSGMIAICAMILPGISGSFILLMMGMYGYVIGAIKDLNLLIILVFAVGALTGLLSFSKLLKWLLHSFQKVTFAALTGIMLGSLVKVWPWKVTESWIEVGQKRLPGEETLIWPSQVVGYDTTGDLLLPLLCMIVGVLSVFLIDYIFLRYDTE